MPTGKTHLEVFDRLHGSSMDLQLILAKPALQQFLISEFKGHLFVSSHSHRGLEFLKGPPYRAATESEIIALKEWFPTSHPSQLNDTMFIVTPYHRSWP